MEFLLNTRTIENVLLLVFLIKTMVHRSIHLRNLNNMICEYKLSKNLSGHRTCCVNAEQTNFRWLADCCFYDNVNNPFSFRQHCFINKWYKTRRAQFRFYFATQSFSLKQQMRELSKKSCQSKESIPFKECVVLSCGVLFVFICSYFFESWI